MGKSTLIDLTGQRFGRFVVLSRAENTKEGRARWLCRCDCGNEKIVPGKDLRSGNTKSCGCYHSDKAHSSRLIDLTGKRFGRLTVLEHTPFERGKKVKWVCLCDCGKEVIVTAGDLTSGDTKSCGCFKHDSTVMRNKELSTTHGGSHDRLFRVWLSMKNRCKGTGCDEVTTRNYSGRGIKVCDEWLGKDGYSNFRKWAYENGYDDTADFAQCTIDRIDFNGNYEPANCRWVDMKTQQNNRRNNRVLEMEGVFHTLAEWCNLYGLSQHLVRDRIEHGWSLQRALTEPKHEGKSRSKFNKP